MKQHLLAVLGLLINLACAAQNTTPPDLRSPELAAQINALAKQYTDLDIFSGVVLIAEKGKPVYQQAFGLANREKNVANSLDTRFDIGSINKLFTKVLVMQLIQEGQLRPEDNLGKYLKGFDKTASEKITIQQLIGHSSGFGDYLQYPDFFERDPSAQSIRAILELVKKMPLLFEPGTEWAYSNAGYVVLGGIIEVVTGKTYYQNIRERIVQPLGMHHTVIDEGKAEAPRRAIGYMKNMRGELENNNGILMIPTPAGGFITTAADLLLFVEAYFYSEKLVGEKAKQADDFYSFIQEARSNGRAIPIAGGFQGANAVVYNILRDEQTIIVLANMDEPVAELLARGIFALMNGKTPDTPTLPVMQSVYQAFSNKGADFVKQQFEVLTANFHPEEPKDMILNSIGYNLLASGETDEAVQIFQLNTELFPEIANCWDSYGEGLLKQGDKPAALKAYKKALEIRPGLPSAVQAVKDLEGN